MAKIIITNAGICVNPVLTKVQRSYNGDTPIITFYIQDGTLNPPATQGGFVNIMFQRSVDGGTTWTNLLGLTYSQYQYVWTTDLGAIISLGTLFRFQIQNHTTCGTSTSNASPLVL